MLFQFFVVTFFCNLDRAQTWLPLAALIGGAVVGLIDDVINLRGLGGGAAGLRSPVMTLASCLLKKKVSL